MVDEDKIDESGEDQNSENSADESGEKVTKGVVPAKYAGKYKGSHEDRGDDIGAFFRSQVNGEDGKIDNEKWVDFLAINGMERDDPFITKRMDWFSEGVRGAAGRIAMDGRNKCTSLARAQEDRLKGINGRWTKFDLPPKKKAPKRKKKEDAESTDAG